ncbi:MAG: radical SAM protein [Candidatus Riflebacteria bacterium]|nr:radical SAM protein [Candidatus Riflebacteria bacterium]
MGNQLKHSANMKPRLLLTTAIGPFGEMDGASINDIHESRMTHCQGIFTQRSYYPALPLYILAQNITAPATVLENPTLADFEAEVKTGYDYIGITFPPIFLAKVYHMCMMIRSLAPNTRIILGGYGVFCLEENVGIARKVKELAHHVCRGEGVRFLRELLGESLERPITQNLPRNYTYFMDQPASVLCNLVSSLGCNNDCEFCGTSAFFNHKKVYLLSPGQLWDQMKKNALSDKSELTWIYDEDFFDPPEYAREFGKLIKAQSEVPRHKINWGALGSVRSLSQFSIEEFHEMGVNHIWVGIESKFSDLPKRQGKDIRELFETFHSAGIMTIGSFIIGQDCQTPKNIEEDIAFFADINPTFTQVTGLLPCPGTKLWKRLEADNRLGDFENISWEDYHMFHVHYKPKYLADEDVLKYIRMTYERSFNKCGPSILRAMEVHLNGLLFSRRSHNPLIQARENYYTNMCRQIYPVLFSIKLFAPSLEVAKRVDQMRRTYHKLLGTSTLQARATAIGAAIGAAFLKIRPKSWAKKIDRVSRITRFNGATN